jgi:Ala-tRNA(Pro) deacylase
MQEIYDALKQLAIPFTEYKHPPVFTTAEAEEHYKNVPGGVSKNIFLRNKKGTTHYLVVIEGSKTIDLNKLRAELNETKLGFASPERLKKYLNSTPGSVSPFGLLFDKEKEVKVIVDQDLLSFEQLHYHPNINTSTLVIAKDDLLKFIEWTGHEVTLSSTIC